MPKAVEAVQSDDKLDHLQDESTVTPESVQPAGSAHTPEVAEQHVPTAEPQPPSVDVAALKRQFAAAALARVQSSKFYPQAARSEGHSGEALSVRLKFQVGSNGSLISVRVTTSSGNSIIDDAAVQAVRRAAPFASFPEGLTDASLALAVTLEYRLK